MKLKLPSVAGTSGRLLRQQLRILAMAASLVFCASLLSAQDTAPQDAPDDVPQPVPVAPVPEGVPVVNPDFFPDDQPANGTNVNRKAGPPASTSGTRNTGSYSNGSRPGSSGNNGGNSGGYSSRSRSRDREPSSSRSSSTNGSSSGATTNSAPRSSFEYYKLVSDRNIFDASRRPRSSGTPGPVIRQPKVESFTLTGIMSYEKGDFGFFDGSATQYRKVVKVGDTIAGYTVKEVTANSTKLDREGEAIELKVGMQMRREDEGKWSLSLRSSTAMSASSSTSGSSTNSGDTNSAAADSGGDVNDVLKRLMQQREKEMNK